MLSGEERGIGGIFFDDLDDGKQENLFQFVKVLIPYGQKPPLNFHAGLTSKIWSNFQLHPYFVYASSEGSGESAHFALAFLNLYCPTTQEVQKSHVLAHRAIKLSDSYDFTRTEHHFYQLNEIIRGTISY